MGFTTPFFHSFRTLLFGKPPVSSLKKAMADLPRIVSLAELRQLLGAYFPAANQALYPQSSSQKPGCGFPLMNLVGIFCMSSGALLAVAKGARRTHETKLFASLWHTVEKGDVLVEDRGFCSFGALSNLCARGADVLIDLRRSTLLAGLPAQTSPTRIAEEAPSR
jgi:hypothetical protein